MSNNSNPFDDDFLKNFGAQDANEENSDSRDDISENLSFDFNFGEESAVESVSEPISDFNFESDSEIAPEITEEIPVEMVSEVVEEVSFEESFAPNFAEETAEVSAEVTPETQTSDEFLNFLGQATESSDQPQVETENYVFNFMQTEESPAEEVPVEEAVSETTDDLFNFNAPVEEVPVEEVAEEIVEEVMEEVVEAEEIATEEAVEEVTEEVEEIIEEVAEEEISDETAEEVEAEEMMEEPITETEVSAEGGFDFMGLNAESTTDLASSDDAPVDILGSVAGMAVTEVAEGLSAAETAVEEAGEAPKTVKKVIRRAKPKKKRSVVGELIKIVLGALCAFPLAHYIVWGIYLGTGKPGPGGLYKIPTPFIQASYKYAKDFPQVPLEVWKYTMLGFDPARDLAPDPEPVDAPLVAQNPVVPQSTEVVAPENTGEMAENADSFAEEADGEFAMGDDFAGDFDDSAIDQFAAEAVKITSDNLPEYDAKEVVFDWNPANQDAFQTAMQKVSFLKDNEDSKALIKTAKEEMKKVCASANAQALNEAVIPFITKENHGKGVLVVGTIKTVLKRGDFNVLAVTLDGTDEEVKIIHPVKMKFLKKGAHCAFTGVVFDPEQDEKVSGKEVLIWRGISTQVPKAKKVKKAEKVKPADEKPTETPVVKEATPVADPAPAETPTVEESAPVEAPAVEEATPAETPAVEEPAPAETPAVEEATPAETPAE